MCIRDRNNGYKVPEGYFSELEDTLLDKVKNLESIEDVLKNYKGTHGYTTPESYFDTLEKRVLEKVKPKVIPLFSWKKIAISTATIAASLVLAFSIYNYSSTKQTTNTIAAIDTAQIHDYIDNGELDLTLFEVEDLLFDQNIDLSTLNNESLQEELLYEYLEDRLDIDYILTE